MEEYNTIIIGAGISGISCAIYLKRAGLSVLIIENNVPGGQLNKISTIENYPGYTSVNGSELAGNLLEQISMLEVDVVYDEISSIDFFKKIILVGEKKYSYKYLVFATGRRERKLELALEEEFIGRGISFCATCDGALYRNQDVIVVGGGSSAVSEAIYLSQVCRKVYLIYRNDELRAENILRKRLEELSNVEIIYNRVILEYLIEDNKLIGVCLDNKQKVLASCVFLAIGHLPNSELFVGDKKDNYILVNENGETSISDVYACGDVVLKQLYQLVTASNDGVVVANDIIHKNTYRD